MAHARAEGVLSRALVFARRPGEVTTRSDGRTCWSTDQSEGEDLNGDVVVTRRGREAQQRLFVHGLVADATEHGGDGDGLAITQGAIADAHVEGVLSRALGFRGCPGEVTTRSDGRACWSTDQ